jgi:small subunit ribosomal protein S9
MPRTKKTTEKKAKPKPKKAATKETQKKAETEKEKKLKYFEAVGRRKTATARVRLFTQGEKEIIINDKPYKDYFPIFSLQKKVEDPLRVLKCFGKFGFSIKVKGGGVMAQAEACRHGIARTLVLLNPLFKKRLRKAGFLTRDPRMRERKKFGLKRARRAPQWSKR